VPIAADLTCIFCGYNLRGLSRDGRCPECGRAVMESAGAARGWMVDARGRWAMIGASLTVWPPVLLALAMGGLIFDSFSPPQSGTPGVSLFPALLVVAVGAVVVWLLGGGILLWIFARIAAARPRRLGAAGVCLVGVALSLVVEYVARDSLEVMAVTAAVAPVLLAVAYLILMGEMSRLMNQARRRDAAWAALVARSLIGLALGGYLVGGLFIGSVEFLDLEVGGPLGVLCLGSGFLAAAGGVLAVSIAAWRFGWAVRRVRDTHVDAGRQGAETAGE
jgi:hypothetical protein